MNRERGGVSAAWKAFAIFLAIVLVAAGILTGVFYALGDITFGQAEEQSEAKAANGGMVLAADESSDAVVAMSAIAEEAFGDYGISESAESAELVTATLTPSGASYISAVWSVSWTDGTSEWASGKTVTDYVTVTPTEDNDLSAAVACLQPFGERVTVGLTVTGDGSVTANCTADYLQKIKDLSLTFGDVICDFESGVTQVPMQVNQSGTMAGGVPSLNYEAGDTYTLGLVEEVSYSLSARTLLEKDEPSGASSDLRFCDYAESGGYDYSVFDNYSVQTEGLYFGLSFFVEKLGLHAYSFPYQYAPPEKSEVYDKDAAYWENEFETFLSEDYNASFNGYINLFDLTLVFSCGEYGYRVKTAFVTSDIVNTVPLSSAEFDEDEIAF